MTDDNRRVARPRTNKIQVTAVKVDEAPPFIELLNVKPAKAGRPQRTQAEKDAAKLEMDREVAEKVVQVKAAILAKLTAREAAALLLSRYGCRRDPQAALEFAIAELRSVVANHGERTK